VSKSGTSCIIVGYAKNHSCNVLRMLNLDTHTIINSRDIIWLNKTCKDWVIDRSNTSISNEYDVIELPSGINIRRVYDYKNNVEFMDGNNIKTNEKVLRVLKKLEGWFNPQARHAIDNHKEGQETSVEQVNLALFSTSKACEPSSFHEAWNNKDEKHQRLWSEAINKDSAI
jgi:hypothetical protein